MYDKRRENIFMGKSFISMLTFFKGSNSFGECGQGRATRHISTPMVIEALENKGVYDIYAVGLSSFAFARDGTLYAWFVT
jgi:alpha-tubulin suppressor-like RCC1 family protein